MKIKILAVARQNIYMKMLKSLKIKKHLNIKISGQVQGVFFRHSARQKAKELGITGLARNEPDGTLYMEAEGEEEKLKIFLEWCFHGPPSAAVEKVDFRWQPDRAGRENLKNFSAQGGSASGWKEFVIK